MSIRENQTTEFKVIWKDEYLKNVCAFANSQGGKLYVGLNDKGTVIGLKHSAKLLEDIPNKTVQLLGVTVTLSSENKENNEYIIINVPQSSVPISYHGRYYIRSGATVQELKANELQSFILSKLGKTYDELPAEYATIDHINPDTVLNFVKKSIHYNRIAIDAQNDDLLSVLKNLKLIDPGGKLKNAAILLFGKEPLQFFSSVSFRIGRFGENNHDLRFQDVVEGNIFEMPDKVIEILKAKYLISPISYKGLQRIEKLEYPEDALREAILNAIIHKDYTGVHIQLSVYDDKLILWNQGKFPNEISVSQLKEKHPSIPRNKYVADVFFKAGYIEAWGRGIEKIINGFKINNLPEPIIEEVAGGVQITLFKQPNLISGGNDTLNDTLNDTINDTINDRQKVILKIISSKHGITLPEIAIQIDVGIATVKRDIDFLKEKNIIKRIGSRKTGYWQIKDKSE